MQIDLKYLHDRVREHHELEMKQLVQGEGEYAEEKWTTEDATEERDGETKHQGQQTERYITAFRDRAEGGVCMADDDDRKR